MAGFAIEPVLKNQVRKLVESPSLRSGDARVRPAVNVPMLGIEFSQQFWPDYPHKVGKPKALGAFIAARRRGNSVDAIVTFRPPALHSRETTRPAMAEPRDVPLPGQVQR